MAKFTDYTQKTKPADADLLLIHDNAGAANKKTPFSGVWSWILDKLASAVISQLETTNKSIIPAINELNSKTNSGLIPKRIPSADLNNAYSSNAGITVYVCVPSDANIPKSETGFVISIKFDTSASLQLYIALNSAVIYKRAQTGSWSEW